MKSIIRIISDFQYYRHNDFNNYKKPTISHIVVPYILCVSDTNTERINYYLEKYGKEIREDVFTVNITLGNEFSHRSTTKTFYFTTKARAEVCRDNILEAIDQYWMNAI